MRMKLALLAALTALAPAAAQAADNDQKTVGVTGNVAKLCVLGEPTPASVDLGQMASTSGSRVGKITAIADQGVTLPGSFCNYAGTQLTVEASALLADDASLVQSGFARAVNFTSTVSNWTATPATVTTAATDSGATPSASAAGATQSAPKLANLDLVLSGFTVPSDALLVAGGYTGSVTITLGPSATP